MLLAYYLHDLSPFLIEFGDNFGLRWYGLAYVAAFLTGYWLYKVLCRRGYAKLPESQVGDFMTWWVVLGTLLGGRLGYIIFYQWPGFLADPWSIFRVWEGGMSAHGGMLGLIIATWLYSWKTKVPWLNLGDNLVVVAPLGLFFGRVANFINGELFGRPTTVPWAVQFPKEIADNPPLAAQVQGEFFQRLPAHLANQPLDALLASAGNSPIVREILEAALTPRHPSQLYQALAEGLLLFVILWIARTRFRLPDGTLTGLFFIAYGILRSIGEFFREPDAPLTGFLTRGQFLSLFAILVGLAFIAAAQWLARNSPATPPNKSRQSPRKNSR